MLLSETWLFLTSRLAASSLPVTMDIAGWSSLAWCVSLVCAVGLWATTACTTWPWPSWCVLRGLVGELLGRKGDGLRGPMVLFQNADSAWRDGVA